MTGNAARRSRATVILMALSGVGLGIQGVVEARPRWQQAHDLADADRFTIAVTEALMWAAAVDEMLRGHRPYRTYRDGSEGGRLLVGLRWARNQGVHRCVAAHSTGLGHGYPRRYPTPDQFEATWLPRSALPPEKKQNLHDQKAYDDDVAGKDVRLSLWAIDDFLTRDGFADATANVPPGS